MKKTGKNFYNRVFDSIVEKWTAVDWTELDLK